MGVVRSVLVGLLVAFVAAIGCTVVQVIFAVIAETWRMSQPTATGGIGSASFGIGIEVPGLPTIICAAIGFALGFTWHRRRIRKLSSA